MATKLGMSIFKVVDAVFSKKNKYRVGVSIGIKKEERKRFEDQCQRECRDQRAESGCQMMNTETPISTESRSGRKNAVEEINFKVTVEEANLILEGLGHIPFAKVFTLVAKIQKQAHEQLNGENPPSEQADPGNPGLAIKDQADAK